MRPRAEIEDNAYRGELASILEVLLDIRDQLENLTFQAQMVLDPNGMLMANLSNIAANMSPRR